jgi:hypothetical protein
MQQFNVFFFWHVRQYIRPWSLDSQSGCGMSYKNFIPHITASFEELNAAEASTTFNGQKECFLLFNIKLLKL